MAVRTRITSRGIIEEYVRELPDEVPNTTLVIDVKETIGGNIVIWAPFLDPLPAGAVATWEEAVTALSLHSGPTTLQISADPWNDEVIIPGGTWDLNDTTIVGTTTYAHGGYNWQSMPGSHWAGSLGSASHRGAQILLYVRTQGLSDSQSVVSNPCRLNGVRGLKDMFFRGEGNSFRSGSGGLITNVVEGTTYDWNVTISNNGDGTFYPADVGRRISMNGGNSDLVGTWKILTYIDANTVIFGTDNSEPQHIQTGISWDIDFINSVFHYNETFGKYGEFILDNVDFRQGGSSYGSFNIGCEGRLFLRLLNAASVRLGSFGCNGKVVVQGDGSPCWIGLFAFSGDGYAKFFVEPGMQFNLDQCLCYDAYQSTIYYQAATPSNWSNNAPLTIHDALDRIATALSGSSL